MADENLTTPTVPPNPAVPSTSSTNAPATTTPVAPHPLPHMGEEFGTAKKSLPPAKIILIAIAVLVAVGGIIVFVQRPQATATGTIDNITSVAVPDQNSVMVAISVSVHNGGQKPFWVRTTSATLEGADGKQYSDDGLSAMDFDRYYQAFPSLKENAYPALQRESKINPGGDVKGTMIVSFPVAEDAFASRKSLSVTIQPYDQPVPLVIKK